MALNFFQRHPVLFQGRKNSQKERGRECATLKLVGYGRFGFGLEPMLFEPFG